MKLSRLMCWVGKRRPVDGVASAKVQNSKKHGKTGHEGRAEQRPLLQAALTYPRPLG